MRSFRTSSNRGLLTRICSLTNRTVASSDRIIASRELSQERISALDARFADRVHKPDATLERRSVRSREIIRPKETESQMSGYAVIYSTKHHIGRREYDTGRQVYSSLRLINCRLINLRSQCFSLHTCITVCLRLFDVYIYLLDVYFDIYGLS